MDRKHSFFSLDLMNRVTDRAKNRLGKLYPAHGVCLLHYDGPAGQTQPAAAGLSQRRDPRSRVGGAVCRVALGARAGAVGPHPSPAGTGRGPTAAVLLACRIGSPAALARSAKSPDYAGETWTIPSAALGGVPLAARPPVPLQHGQQAARGTRGGATVTIEVKAFQSGEGRKIHVEARFPDDPVRGIVCKREILINRSR